MLVTTAHKPTSYAIEQSMQFAERYGFRWVRRGDASIETLQRQYNCEHVWTFVQNEWKYYFRDHSALFFHPSMAHVRIKRLMRGEKDSLLELAGIVQGDSVLDCTAGLASDSLVFGFAVGKTGHVTAVESELVLSILLSEALKRFRSPISEVQQAIRMIDFVHSHHLDVLKTYADQSFDVVYFDPMFRFPIHESSVMSPVREIANDAPLQTQAIEEACRVARRCVMMKEQKDSEEFQRLGFANVIRTSSKIAYGVIEI